MAWTERVAGRHGSSAPGRCADATVGREDPTNVYASPRSLLSTPRSLLSTPRSLLSTPRSLISSQRREWEAAAAAREELFHSWGGSVRREELRQLSRKQLRRRLLDLGAAPTEGEGLLFGALVDTVLLWNALARLHDGGQRAHREEALLALRDSGLSIDLLQRALLVIGVPAEERRRLKPATAAALLYQRLLPLLSAADADEGETEATNEAARQTEEVQSRWRQKVLEAEDEPCPPLAAWIAGDMSAKATLEAPSPPQPSPVQLARDSKFEALDENLRRSLEEIHELEEPHLRRPPDRPPKAQSQVFDTELPSIAEEVGAEGRLLTSAQRSMGFHGSENLV